MRADQRSDLVGGDPLLAGEVGERELVQNLGDLTVERLVQFTTVADLRQDARLRSGDAFDDVDRSEYRGNDLPDGYLSETESQEILEYEAAMTKEPSKDKIPATSTR